MNSRTFFYAFLLGIAFLSGCHSSHKNERLYNRVLNENGRFCGILELYKDDSLKYQAALFLLDNLAYYQGPDSGEMEFVYKSYEIFSTGKYTYKKSLDSAIALGGIPKTMQNIVWKKDIDMNPGFLVSNIEWAFKVWREQPWGKNVSFEQFCEYILPYRVGNEELMPWREKLYYQFMPIVEKYRNNPNIENPTFIARVILDTLLKEPFYFTGEMESGVRIGPRIVDWRGGSCLDLCDMIVYIYRALGIPCGIDELPVRGNNNVPHYWNFIKDSNGKTWYFSMFYWWHRLLEAEKYADVYGKVFRQRFSLNRDMLDSLQMLSDSIHPVFRYPFFDDVTCVYALDKSFTLVFGGEHFLRPLREKEIVYLCMSSHTSWVPVGWGKVMNTSVVIKNCHGGTIYCLCIYDGKKDELIPISSPFSLDEETGKTNFYESDGTTEDVVLLSKFGMLGEFYIDRMVNGVFEGSNSSAFLNKDTLFIIDEVPTRLTTIVAVDSSESYRYVRYCGSDGSYGNVSEIAFFESVNDTLPVSGKVIGPKEGTEGEHSYFNAFDGKTETSFDYPFANGGWVGLDLGIRKHIGKIAYSPRNRDNFIRKGDMYELWICCQGMWLPKERQMAQSDSLLFKNVPKHTLLLLRNLSRGKAERLFEYKDGKQFFW